MNLLTADPVGKPFRTPRAYDAWPETIVNGTGHANIFASRATEYPRAATQGTWEEAFD